MNVPKPISRETERAPTSFAKDVINGLSSSPKTLPPKYFYDNTGSQLFEQITKLPEYYPTRAELEILRDHGPDIGAKLPHGAALIEFGAGATTKVRLMLEQADFAAYVPVDISGDFLNDQADALRRDFPALKIYPVTADFTTRFALPHEIADMPKVGFFPGSTLGNFEPDEARAFLASARDILGQGAEMIIGIDLEKDERILRAAYNDAAGVTGKFNRNMLERINTELGADIDIGQFEHEAIYNPERHRIEMHLRSLRDQNVHLLGHTFRFRGGETIHTENSYKYSYDRFRKLAANSGWQPHGSWTDRGKRFSVHALSSAA